MASQKMAQRDREIGTISGIPSSATIDLACGGLWAGCGHESLDFPEGLQFSASAARTLPEPPRLFLRIQLQTSTLELHRSPIRSAPGFPPTPWWTSRSHLPESPLPA